MLERRHYTPRLSQKAVLEYLENAYPEWKSFSEIYDEVPILHVDTISPSLILEKMAASGLISKDDHEIKETSRGFIYYRFNRKR